MHRNQWSDVSAIQSRASLSKSKGQVYELYVCRRKFGVDLASGQEPGPQFLTIHSRSDGLCTHISRRRQTNSSSESSDHKRPDSLQIEC